MGAQGGRLGGPQVQGIGAEAGPFGLIAGLETVTGKCQQLGLQVRGQDRQAMAVGGDGDLQRPPPHGPGRRRRRGRVLVIVAHLDRRQPHGQGMQLHRGL